MTIDEMILILQAAKEGKAIQYWHTEVPSPIWRDVNLKSVRWNFQHNLFRVKPEPREFTLFRNKSTGVFVQGDSYTTYNKDWEKITVVEKL